MERNDHESSPAYRCLTEAGLLVNKFRIKGIQELVAKDPNSSLWKNRLRGRLPGYFTAKIDAGHVGLLEDGRGEFFFLRPGLHMYFDMFFKLTGTKRLIEQTIFHGDRAIVTVPQGFIGICKDQGQPVLLPPGLHQWQSSTMNFDRFVDLTRSVIHIDPYTICTVDEGYSAVTQDNGKMVILPGGATYTLSHRNHKFEMFISQKIQTDELRNIKAASADNVVIAVMATVNWRIINVETAARMAADTMLQGGGRNASMRHHTDTDDVHVNASGALDLGKLRNDVLKQAEASLSAFIAMVNYSDTFGVSASVKAHGAATQSGNDPNVLEELPTAAEAGTREDLKLTEADTVEASPLFDLQRLQGMVGHANEVTKIYGVEIFSINIISAFPDDKVLMKSLAAGAVAAAEAQQAETAARGKAAACLIEASGEAEAKLVIANSEAEAKRVLAKASRDAAEYISSSAVAVDLAKIDHAGGALGDRASFFFGANAEHLVKNLIHTRP